MIREIRSQLAGCRILLTGHTGFKGSWAAMWLRSLGGEVHGLALPPPTQPSLFDEAGVAEDVEHFLGDIGDWTVVRDRVADVRPDLVLHMAAQPIVRQSYSDPLETFRTNVMGTAHVLEAVRQLNEACAVVIVSSDKCYDNRGWVWGYRENDPLGGSDPYSASKGATELVTRSWRDSFFPPSSPVRVASARAGNVIGGGDWAADRIVPDCIRAFSSGESVELRNPLATRPWQHVLEPLGGYLLLAARLLGNESDHYADGWNFGPKADDVRPVQDLVAKLGSAWGDSASSTLSNAVHPKEAHALSLNCDKAIMQLGWRQTWSFDAAIEHTAHWYRSRHDGLGNVRALTLAQIASFESAENRPGQLTLE